MREDWIVCRFDEVVLSFKRGPFGGDLKKSIFVENGYKVYEQQHAINNDFSIGRYFVNDETYDKLKTCNVGPGDYIVSCSGTMGKIARLPEGSPLGIINQALLRIRINDRIIDHNYFVNFFRSKIFQDLILKDSRGSGMQNMAGLKEIKPIRLSIPPLSEQRAIVAKIEELFSSLDSGIADLKKAQEQLKIYRQAVLKKAFEGGLTKEWRGKQTTLATADELLEQIKEERKNHYKQQIEDWKKAVKECDGRGKKPSKPSVYKTVEPFTVAELSSLDKLPISWNWVKLGDIFQVFVGSTPSRARNDYWDDGKINWVSSGEVAFKTISRTKEKITELGLKNTSTTIHPIGTVMLAMIGEGKTRGQAAILKINACHNQNTAAIRVSEIGFYPEYLYHYLFLKYQRNRRIGSGNNQKALNQGRIMEFDYPLCSKEEQHQIVQEIESRLSVCDKVEESIVESLEKSKALRQSILMKAFDGKLLNEQELAACKSAPDYEPASVLLERIKAEKNTKK